jgi:hypothetical protein
MSRFPRDLFLSYFPTYMAYIMLVYSKKLCIVKQMPFTDIALDYMGLRFRVIRASVKCVPEVATHTAFIIKETVAKGSIVYSSVIYVWLTVHLELYLYNKPTRCTICLYFIELPRLYMFRALL